LLGFDARLAGFSVALFCAALKSLFDKSKHKSINIYRQVERNWYDASMSGWCLTSQEAEIMESMIRASAPLG
jgi:hypothetical protein